MASSLLLRPRRLAALAACAVAVVPIAGCGDSSSSSSSSGGSTGTDPAALLPAAAPVYVEAQLRPTGELADNAKTVAGKILRTSDPGGKITGLIDDAASDEGVTYKKDIEPWLGQRAGIAVTSIAGGDEDIDIVGAIASKDDDAARAFITKQAGKDGAARKYRDVSYTYDAKDDTAVAVVDHAVLIGTEKAFKSAVDAQAGTASLASAGAFKKARSAVGSDGLGFMYADPGRIFDLALGAAGGAVKGSDAQDLQALKGFLTGSGLESVAASLDVAKDALKVDGAAIGVKGDAAGGGDAAGAVAGVPAGSWLSIGVGDVGGTFKKSLTTLGQAGATGGVDPATLLSQLKAQLGVDVEKDFLSWMGDAALFVRGTGMSDLGGALVVKSKDPAASKAAIPKLEKLLKALDVKTGSLSGADGADGFTVDVGGPLPGGLAVATKDDRFVIAYGKDALKDAFSPSSTLGESDPFKTAAGLLDGAKPTVFVDTPQVVKLIGAFAGSDEDFAKAKPTLDAFGPLAAGTSRDGDVTHVKAAVSIP